MNDETPQTPQNTNDDTPSQIRKEQSADGDKQQNKSKNCLSEYKRRFNNTRAFKSFDEPQPRPKEDD